MANPYFKFKEFTVHHDRCAMKVTTDACLFGAWVANTLALESRTGNTLDIGSGTGLLSLMVAQKNPLLSIDAIEIDKQAASQAAENVSTSPFSKRINIIHQDFKSFNTPKTYDFIFSNPPFHEKQLSGKRLEKNIAHHDYGLSLLELLSSAYKLLQKNGWLLLLLPAYREQEVLLLAQTNYWHLTSIARIRQTPKHDYFRIMLCLSKSEALNIREFNFYISDGEKNYSPEATQLLKDFYLFL